MDLNTTNDNSFCTKVQFQFQFQYHVFFGFFQSSLFKVSFSASVSIVSLFCQNNAIQLIGILLVLDLLKMTLIDSRLSLN